MEHTMTTSQKRIIATPKNGDATHGLKSAAYYAGDARAFLPILEAIFPPNPHEQEPETVVVFPRSKNIAQDSAGMTETS